MKYERYKPKGYKNEMNKFFLFWNLIFKIDTINPHKKPCFSQAKIFIDWIVRLFNDNLLI